VFEVLSNNSDIIGNDIPEDFVDDQMGVHDVGAAAGAIGTSQGHRAFRVDATGVS
jgi:hypothetical protein